MDGTRQTILTERGEKIEIFPKETFETGKVIGKSYSLHFMNGSWWNKPKKYINTKLFLVRCPINLLAWRKQRYAKKVVLRRKNQTDPK